ncbi:VOC family protein [Microbacterium fluvii]|uniref:VOC family protein n=1 Tax=Microbacterium fluvii TaxID=415215 RepID=A0ABW2HF39_9MICO|nr:VOC family protein [Microbacterium fluvii]MCU4673224.1 VOC family protein [Microbacterium fluvii]
MTALDHVGLSVADLDAQAAWYADALGLVPTPAMSNPAIGVRTQYLVDPEDGWAIELLERVGSNPGLQASSPTEAILTRGYGHLCLRVADVAARFAALVAGGARVISAPGPSPMSGLILAYVADPEGNLIEVIERPVPLVEQIGALE